MAATALLTVVYLFMAFAQPFMPSLFGHEKWLIGLTPLLIAYAALRVENLPLMLFILIGGTVHDLLLLHYLGMGPVLWGVTAFLVASQSMWLRDAGLVMFAAIGFITSFFYFSFDRVLYLVYHGFWSWDLDLSYSLLTLAGANALFSPIMFLLFDTVVRRRSRERFKSTYRFG